MYDAGTISDTDAQQRLNDCGICFNTDAWDLVSVLVLMLNTSICFSNDA